MENKMTPKQALEELKFQVGNIIYFTKDLQATTHKVRDSGLFEIIEQALTELEETKVLCESFKNDANQLNEQGIDLYLKYKKQKQILDVLKNKRVDIFLVAITDCVEEYNELLGGNRKNYPLTETEFNLIKEWLEK